MIPFGQAVLLWRWHRGLTQQTLAAKARVPRSNLSSIEQGKREVTLGTLRTLAAALDVPPGVLADGVAPQEHRSRPLSSSREALERIADAVAFRRPVASAGEREAVHALARLVGPRTRAIRRQWRGSPRGQFAALNAWRTLTSLYSRDAITTLVDRIAQRQAAHGPSRH